MYRPCRLFVSKGSGIIWPLLPQLTFVRQRIPASRLLRWSSKHGSGHAFTLGRAIRRAQGTAAQCSQVNKLFLHPLCLHCH